MSIDNVLKNLDLKNNDDLYEAFVLVYEQLTKENIAIKETIQRLQRDYDNLYAQHRIKQEELKVNIPYVNKWATMNHIYASTPSPYYTKYTNNTNGW